MIASVPPPYMGPNLANVVLLQSTLNDDFQLIHLDTSDHREIDTLGVLDFTNVDSRAFDFELDRCPSCGRELSLVDYHPPPPDERRLAELRNELKRVRALRRQAKREGTPLPAGLRRIHTLEGEGRGVRHAHP